MVLLVGVFTMEVAVMYSNTERKTEIQKNMPYIVHGGKNTKLTIIIDKLIIKYFLSFGCGKCHFVETEHTLRGEERVVLVKEEVGTRWF